MACHIPHDKHYKTILAPISNICLIGYNSVYNFHDSHVLSGNGMDGMILNFVLIQ